MKKTEDNLIEFFILMLCHVTSRERENIIDKHSPSSVLVVNLQIQVDLELKVSFAV